MKTLISKYVAKAGYKFLFSGPASECSSCRFKYACLGNLEPGVVYEVVKVYNIVNKCPVVGDVVTVDVKPAEIDVAVDPRSAIEGAIVIYRRYECGKPCSFSELCRNPWLKSGSRVKVISVGNRVECRVGRMLFRVTVLAVPRAEHSRKIS